MIAGKAYRFRTHIGYLDKLKLNYLFISAAMVQETGGSLKQRVLFSVNGSENWHGGFVGLGDGNAYITLNTARLKQLGLSVGDEVDLTLMKDESEFGMEVPAELDELLAQDDEGLKRFMALTPGKQRYIIHYINSVKSSDKRLERSIMLITNLKMTTPGKESFRQMLGKE